MRCGEAHATSAARTPSAVSARSLIGFGLMHLAPGGPLAVYTLNPTITAQDIEKRDRFWNSAKDELGRLRVGAAVGVGEDFLDRARASA